MNRLQLAGGITFIAFGVVWRSAIYINDWNCARSFSLNACVSATFPTLFSYILIVMGLALVTISFLSTRTSHVPTMDRQKNPERVR
jgi:hypothetical protein